MLKPRAIQVFLEMRPQKSHANDLIGIELKSHQHQVHVIGHQAIHRAQEMLPHACVEQHFTKMRKEWIIEPASGPMRNGEFPMNHCCGPIKHSIESRQVKGAIEVWDSFAAHNHINRGNRCQGAQFKNHAVRNNRSKTVAADVRRLQLSPPFASAPPASKSPVAADVRRLQLSPAKVGKTAILEPPNVGCYGVGMSRRRQRGDEEGDRTRYLTPVSMARTARSCLSGSDYPRI